MLDNVDTSRGEQFVAGDVYDVNPIPYPCIAISNRQLGSQQVATAISSATPKIQKWISEAETDDPESLGGHINGSYRRRYPHDSLAVFLQINDQINSVVSRYEAFKRGDYVAAANPVPPELGYAFTYRVFHTYSHGPRYSQMPAKDSLIDLMDGEPAAPSGNGSTKPTDDLADIFGPTVAAPSTALSAPSSQTRAADIMNLFTQAAPQSAAPSLFHPQPQFQPLPQQQPLTGGYQGQVGQIMLPSTPQPQNPGANPTLRGSSAPPQQTAQQQVQPQKDPFADLAELF
jgi:ADP-ribosylation factor-binding protein GGA